MTARIFNSMETVEKSLCCLLFMPENLIVINLLNLNRAVVWGDTGTNHLGTEFIQFINRE